MEERLPAQIYVVGNFLLLLVVVLVLLMMPRAMAFNPDDFGLLADEEKFEEAAGLDRLGASGLPELRIWTASDAGASGIVVTTAAIERYDLSRRSDWRERFEVTQQVRETTRKAAQAILSLRDLAAYDSHFMVCGSGKGGVSVSGYVDGREFNFRETGDCTAARSPAVDGLFKLIAPKG